MNNFDMPVTDDTHIFDFEQRITDAELHEHTPIYEQLIAELKQELDKGSR